MTRINRMVMQGFKSFAKYTELPFGPKYNCILGPNGSGKCVTGGTLVQLGDGSTLPIKEIVEKAQRFCDKKIIDDGVIYYGGNEEVMSLDTDRLRSRPKKILAYVKRTSPEWLVRISTLSGKSITATPYHPLFTLKNSELVSIKAEDLREGVRIAMPRHINPVIKNSIFYELIDIIEPEDGIFVPFNHEYIRILNNLRKKKSWKELSGEMSIPLNSIKGIFDSQSVNFSYLIRILRHSGLGNDEIVNLIPLIKSKTGSVLFNFPWKNTLGLSKILGYLLSGGRLDSKTGQIWFTHADEAIISDYTSLWKEEFNIEAYVKEYKPMCWDVLVYSKPLIQIMSKLGMVPDMAENRYLSNVYLSHSTNEELSRLLDGLYSADGYVSERAIGLATKSRKLAYSVESILLRLGIPSQSRFVVKMACNAGFTGVYKAITVLGADNIRRFNDSIRLTHNDKYQRINQIINPGPNLNIHLADVNNLIKKTAKEPGISARKSGKLFPKADSYCPNQRTPSAFGVQNTINDIFLPSGVCQSLIQLKKLAFSDIYWDEIAKIEYIQSTEKWVYDLCVEKDHNFVANNFFVHNSNVLDALCFVLGKSSAKSLRAEKSSNLIYNGGKQRKPAKHGEVSIYFDNSQKTFPTDSPEVKITRIVRHSGQSIYKINDETRTRQEIVDLLSIAKINPDGYNVILQGDIIRFVEMHPVERRQLIEGISGISIYEEKKHKAMSELQRVDEKLKETEIVLAERSTYLKELKKDRDQALKYKEMNDKIRQHKASFLKIQIDKKDAEHAEYQQKIAKSNEELSKINSKVDELRKKNRDKKAEIEKITKEIEEKGETEQIKLNREVESLKIEITKINSRVDACKNEVSRIRQRRADMQQALSDTDEKIKQLLSEKSSLVESSKSSEKEKAALAQKLLAFKQKNNLDNIGEIEKGVEDIDRQAEELQKQINELRERQHSLIREKDTISHEISSIDASLMKILDIEKEYKSQLDDLKNKRLDFKKSVLELNKCLDEDSKAAIDINEFRKEHAALSGEIEKLRARDIGRREVTRSDIAVKKILELKTRQSGIYGTVSELGTVSSKYSLALEVAAGPRLKSIVVEDDKVVSECIKYLKANKVGIATFLPVNKVKSRLASAEIRKIADSKGSHGIALGLLSFDKKFTSVFSYIFGETIVVDNIDVARRLGIGNAKFVTLDGDVAETSGLMQGGFRIQAKGMGFQEKDLTADIEGKESALQSLASRVSTLEKMRAENEEIISKLRERKASLEGDIIKTEKSMHLESADSEASKERKKDLESREKKADDDIAVVSREITSLNRKLAQLKTDKQLLRSQIFQLRNPAMLAELNAFEAKIKQIDESLIKSNSEIKGIDSQVHGIYSPEKSKTEQILRQLDKDESQFETEQREHTKSIEEKNSILLDKEKKAKDFYAQFKALFATRGKIDDEISKNEAAINNGMSESRTIEMKNNISSLKNASVAAELAGLKQEFVQYEGVVLDTTKPEEELKREIGRFERMRESIGSVNMRALEIYDEVEKQYNSLQDKNQKLSSEKEDVLAMMLEIESKKKELFIRTFNVINSNFQGFFSALSTKGEANLVLEEPENPFDGGLRVNVKITGSKFMDIRSLSGGEKTLTALAFIFAIQEHEPASFYVLDEVDAALDKHNSEKLAKLVRKYADKAQYIIISHNDSVISESDNLYGVSMNEHGMSKVIMLKI